MINAFQIHYEDSQAKDILFQPYKNSALTPFFENAVFEDLHNQGKLCKGDLCGVLSWRFKKKVRVGPRVTIEQIERYAESGVKVLGFHTEYLKTKHNPFKAGDGWHRGLTPTFSEMCRIILEKIGHTIDMNFVRKGAVIYSNYFLCHPDIMQEYLEDWLLPAMKLMREDEQIREMAWQDSKYYRSKNPKIREILKKELKISYYPCHAFILERFFTAFLQKNSKLPITHYLI